MAGTDRGMASARARPEGVRSLRGGLQAGRALGDPRLDARERRCVLLRIRRRRHDPGSRFVRHRPCERAHEDADDEAPPVLLRSRAPAGRPPGDHGRPRRRGQGDPFVRRGDGDARAPRRHAARSLVSDRDRPARRTRRGDVGFAAHGTDHGQEPCQRDGAGVRRDEARRKSAVTGGADAVAVLDELPAGPSGDRPVSVELRTSSPTGDCSCIAATRRGSGTLALPGTGTGRC
jgi:hypothetical protein